VGYAGNAAVDEPRPPDAWDAPDQRVRAGRAVTIETSEIELAIDALD
jgi:hypothetical protein